MLLAAWGALAVAVQQVNRLIRVGDDSAQGIGTQGPRAPHQPLTTNH